MKNKTFKQALITFGIMLTALIAFNAIGVMPAFAQIGVTPQDLPSALEGSQGDIRDLAKTLLNYILGFLGLIAVVFVIYAGFLYVTSAGNEDNAGKAKTIITYAIVGIIIILASAAIVNFALRATSAPTTSPTTSSGTL